MSESAAHMAEAVAGAPPPGFLYRLIQVLRLEAGAYAAVREDPGTWVQSLAIVLIVALAHGGGALLRAPSQGGPEAPLFTFFFGFQGEILLWLGMSGSLWLVSRLLRQRTAGFGQIARPLGFSLAPGAGVLLAGALSAAGPSATVPVLAGLGAWRLAASYQAIREGLVLSRHGASAYLLTGLVAGIGLMAAGTALLNSILSG
jgi:hypothetical protein